jgi:hypothetical protein
MVQAGGFEPPTYCLKDSYSTVELRQHGAQEETRTPKTVLLRHIRLPIASLELVGTSAFQLTIPWWEQVDSDHLPSTYQIDALPVVLYSRMYSIILRIRCVSSFNCPRA